MKPSSTPKSLAPALALLLSACGAKEETQAPQDDTIELVGIENGAHQAHRPEDDKPDLTPRYEYEITAPEAKIGKMVNCVFSLDSSQLQLAEAYRVKYCYEVDATRSNCAEITLAPREDDDRFDATISYEPVGPTSYIPSSEAGDSNRPTTDEDRARHVNLALETLAQCQQLEQVMPAYDNTQPTQPEQTVPAQSEAQPTQPPTSNNKAGGEATLESTFGGGRAEDKGGVQGETFTPVE